MKDFIKLKAKPSAAEGRVCIDLIDPYTGKVKDRVKGENRIFTDSLFSGYQYDWTNTLNYAYVCLNDTTIPINANIPYLFGQTVGYGIPNEDGSGLYRGAYNAANQVLKKMTLNSVRWKYQYDFTPAQANDGTIRVVGITSQYSTSHYNYSKQYIKGFTTAGYSPNDEAICDGRYVYDCSNAGIVTIYDAYLHTNSTIDLSITVGTTGLKIVGYALDTGHFYIYVYSTTASLRKMYEFSDSSFSTLLNTYSVSALTISSQYPMYVYNDRAYFFVSSNIYYADFINNEPYSTIAVDAYSNAMVYDSAFIKSSVFRLGTCVLGNNYIFCASAATSSINRKGIIFDLATEEAVAFVYTPSGSSEINIYRHPITEGNIICASNLRHNAAISAYKLQTPVSKTSANGMTVTYELEVFW